MNLCSSNQLTVSYDGAIQRALVYGIVQLGAEGKFNPKEKITRAEATEQIFDALEYIEAHPA